MVKSHELVLQSEQIKTNMSYALAALANARIREWVTKFTKRFPRIKGEIIFGMGVERVEIGGKTVDNDQWSDLQAAMEDVWEITGNYTLACPDDIQFGGKKRRKKR